MLRIAFQRACSIAEWAEGKATTVRGVSGVYSVMWPDGLDPVFLPRSRAGQWKRRDPTIPLDRLQARWIPGASILYIGAGENVKTRIDLLVQFGSGVPAMHWGGRGMWQLKDIGAAGRLRSATPHDCERCVENE